MILRISGNFFVDETGKPLVLRGRDAGIEDAPEGRPFPVEEAEARFAEFRGKGTGALRLGLRMDCVEGPAPGSWNEAWLAYIRKILAALDRQGIAAFLSALPRAAENLADDAAGSAARFLETFRHACRRLKNCPALCAWGIGAGRDSWISRLPAAEGEALFTAFREGIREYYPEALFFVEDWPGDAGDFARRPGLVPPELLADLFG
jgi:hypothetical protein